MDFFFLLLIYLVIFQSSRKKYSKITSTKMTIKDRPTASCEILYQHQYSFRLIDSFRQNKTFNVPKKV